ncbi:MAG: hypothetical protein PHH77_01695 [Victivallaceae bacterium]|nr:hypothetical protein [Victivallaceae bacterium]
MKKCLMALALAGCCFLPAGCSKQDSSINSLIEVNLQKHNRELVNLGEAYPERWDKFYVFEPYTPKEKIERTLGCDFSGNSRISRSESISLLIFVKDGKVVSWTDYPRHRGDFSKLYRSEGYLRKKAIFKVADKSAKWLTFTVLHKNL